MKLPIRLVPYREHLSNILALWAKCSSTEVLFWCLCVCQCNILAWPLMPGLGCKSMGSAGAAVSDFRSCQIKQTRKKEAAKPSGTLEMNSFCNSLPAPVKKVTQHFLAFWLLITISTISLERGVKCGRQGADWLATAATVMTPLCCFREEFPAS